MDKPQQAILLLAAGASRRMGQPKQLLVYEGQPLIAHLLDLLCAQGRPVFVVLGAQHEQIEEAIAAYRVAVLVNSEWEVGMGGSLQLGLRQIQLQLPGVKQVLVTVVDQALLDQEVLTAFWTLGKLQDLVAAQYAPNDIGVPVLFGQTHFEALLTLPPQQGANKFLRSQQDHITTVSFPEGTFDLDYPADWDEFLRRRAIEKDLKTRRE